MNKPSYQRTSWRKKEKKKKKREDWQLKCTLDNLISLIYMTVA